MSASSGPTRYRASWRQCVSRVFGHLAWLVLLAVALSFASQVLRHSKLTWYWNWSSCVPILVTLVVCGAALAAFYWHICWLDVDDGGLVALGPWFSRRRIRWSEIERVERTNGPAFPQLRVTYGGSRTCCVFFGMSNAAEFLAQLRAAAPDNVLTERVRTYLTSRLYKPN